MQNWAGAWGRQLIGVTVPSPSVQSIISVSTPARYGSPARQGLISSVSQLLQGRSLEMFINNQRYKKVHLVPTI